MKASLNAAQGVFLGVAVGAVIWAVIVGTTYAIVSAL